MDQMGLHYVPSIPYTYEKKGMKQITIQGKGEKQAFTVCVTSTALSMTEEGYSVFVNSDASGAFDENTASDAKDYLRAAGVNVLSMFAVALELMRDWRNTPGTPEMLPFFDQ